MNRVIDRLASDPDTALAAIREVRAAGRSAARAHRCPVPQGDRVPVDIDGSVPIAHSEKESAAPTLEPTFAFHSLLAFGHAAGGAGGGGEPLAGQLSPRTANANTAADHTWRDQDTLRTCEAAPPAPHASCAVTAERFSCPPKNSTGTTSTTPAATREGQGLPPLESHPPRPPRSCRSSAAPGGPGLWITATRPRHLVRREPGARWSRSPR